MRLLGDDDVVRLADPRQAVAIMRDALLARARGGLESPARVVVSAGPTDLTFGAGGMHHGVTGFRVYGGWGPHSDQLTVVWDRDGVLLGGVTGQALGILRTGALGGVAIDVLARPEAARVGIIGSGRMAWGQIWAAAAMRRLERVDVFSPHPERRSTLAARIRTELGVDGARAVDRAEDAVRDHDIVIVASTSTEPVLSAEWIAPGAHVTSVGPKRRAVHEIGPDVARRASVVVADAPAQVDPGDWFASEPPDELAAHVEGSAPRRGPDDVTLYCSLGLTGTEPLLAHALLSAASS